MSGGQRTLFYLLSFFVPVAGIVLGVIWLNEEDMEKKQVGKTCLIVAIVSLALGCICWFAASALSMLPAFVTY